MRRINIFLMLMCGSFFPVAQESSKLYEKVLNIMKNELNYSYDSTSDMARPRPLRQEPTDSSSNRLPHSWSSLPLNFSPLVLLDGLPVKMDDLKLLGIEGVQEINIMNPNDINCTTLYGTRGAKGVILLKSKNSD